MSSINNNHKCRFVKWMAASDGKDQYYKLTCLECGKFLGQETYIPFDYDIIDLNERNLQIKIYNGKDSEQQEKIEP